MIGRPRTFIQHIFSIVGPIVLTEIGLSPNILGILVDFRETMAAILDFAEG